MTSIPPSPLFNLTLFTPKAGATDAFTAAQLQGLPTFGPITGLRTSQLFVQDGGEMTLNAKARIASARVIDVNVTGLNARSLIGVSISRRSCSCSRAMMFC